jgi:hypothetical protein
MSQPVGSNRETKKLIRTHVIQDHQRRKRDHERPVEKSCDTRPASANTPSSCKSISRTSSEETEVSIPRQPFGLLDPFTTFPVNMEPYMYTLIHRCKPYPVLSPLRSFPSPSLPSSTNPNQHPLTHNRPSDLSVASTAEGHSLLSLSQNPSNGIQGLLPLALTDAALFHSLLCGSALWVDLRTGRGESLEKYKHMKEAIHLLSTRLKDTGPEVLSDSTILAVAHLATFEVCVSFCLGRGGVRG